jgi:tRNA G18 (ribose-2'-O)-methylase SpoU
LARIIPVEDPADPRLAAFRDIRERDLVGREGRFVAEGEVVLRVLLTRARHAAEALLIADKRIEGLSDLLALLDDQTPVYSAAQPVMDAIAGFHIHRGILAVGRRAADPPAAELLAGLDDRALVLGLFGIANHDNMGGLLRNAAAFGVDAIVLDSNCCDPLYRKAIRVSVGAALVVPFGRLSSGEDALALLERFGLEAIALSPSADLPLARLIRPPKAALLLGAEGPGLALGLLQRACAVAIPMAAGMDSLNVATASGIALHHLAFSGH